MVGIWELLIVNLLILWVFMTCGWVVSLVRKNVSIADICWGLGFTLIAWATFFRVDGFLWRRVLISVLVSIWGIRLAYHYGRRNWDGESDWRYVNFREQYGKRTWWISLVGVFGFLNQGNALWVISLVVQAGQWYSHPSRFTWLDGLGAVLWLAGFIFEAVADQQLYRFKADPINKGKIMDKGLWSFSRHPNYFGEVMIWWGIFLIALSSYPEAIWTVISPIVITVIMCFWTGVPGMEKYLKETYPQYKDYMAKTNAFIPWFPQKVNP